MRHQNVHQWYYCTWVVGVYMEYIKLRLHVYNHIKSTTLVVSAVIECLCSKRKMNSAETLNEAATVAQRNALRYKYWKQKYLHTRLRL